MQVEGKAVGATEVGMDEIPVGTSDFSAGLSKGKTFELDEICSLEAGTGERKWRAFPQLRSSVQATRQALSTLTRLWYDLIVSVKPMRGRA